MADEATPTDGAETPTRRTTLEELPAAAAMAEHDGTALAHVLDALEVVHDPADGDRLGSDRLAEEILEQLDRAGWYVNRDRPDAPTGPEPTEDHRRDALATVCSADYPFTYDRLEDLLAASATVAGFLAGVPALTPVAIPTDEGGQEHLGEELARTVVETLKASATDYPTKRALARILRAAASGLTAAVPEVEAEAALAEPF